MSKVNDWTHQKIASIYYYYLTSLHSVPYIHKHLFKSSYYFTVESALNYLFTVRWYIIIWPRYKAYRTCTWRNWHRHKNTDSKAAIIYSRKCTQLLIYSSFCLFFPLPSVHSHFGVALLYGFFMHFNGFSLWSVVLGADHCQEVVGTAAVHSSRDFDFIK